MILPDDLDALARRVLLDESGDERTPTALITAVDDVFAKMKTDLSRLVGTGGASALVRRALTQAQRDLPLLRGIEYDPEGGLQGVGNALAEAKPDEVEEAVVAAFVHLLQLLVALLGPDLGLRSARKHWPEAFLALNIDSKEADA